LSTGDARPFYNPYPPVPPPSPRRGGGRTAVAVLAAMVLIASSVVIGVALTADGDGNEDGAAGGDTPSPTENREDIGEEQPAAERPPDDPRQPMPEQQTPVVGDDWQVVISSLRHVAFDVPPEWEVVSESKLHRWDDIDTGESVFVLEGGATYGDGQCGEGPRALVGTRGAQGTTGTAEASELTAALAGWAAFYQTEEGTTSVTEPEPFETPYGITGHITYATVTDLPTEPDDDCAAPGGLSIGISFLNSESDLVAWSLIANTEYDGELSQDTIDRIVGSLRPYHLT
jgi:hypothetical protein